MNKEQIVSCITELSHSQGFYGRVLEVLNDELLTKLGAKLAFSCITHDYYYSKRHMEGLTENEMKNACIRLRDCQGLNRSLNSKKELLKKEKELLEQGYKKVFDTSNKGW